jgi:putative oxidoreductase
MAMSVTSSTTANADRETERTQSGKRARKNNVLWAAQLVLAVFFVFAAVPKLAGANSAVASFAQIGAGQWLRYLVGTAELAGAIGLVIPRLAGLAAAGLAADMAGASIINIAVLHSAAAALTIPLCAAFALIARARWQHTTKPLATTPRR